MKDSYEMAMPSAEMMEKKEVLLPSAEPNTAGDSKTPRTPGSGGKRKGPRRNRKTSPGATPAAAPGATLVVDDEDEDDRQLEVLDKLIGLSLNSIPSIDAKATSVKAPAPENRPPARKYPSEASPASLPAPHIVEPTAVHRATVVYGSRRRTRDMPHPLPRVHPLAFPRV